MPLISIIIPTWNAEDLLRECLGSLRKQSHKDFETIVVDNASEDGTLSMVEKDFPEVKLLRLAENKGFTGGNIEGLKCAGGKFIALLNNDTEVSSSWLENLIQPMFNDPKVGICTSKVIVKGSDILDSAGGGLTTAFSGFKIGMGQKANLYNERQYVSGGYACACLYRKKMIDDIGFLDEDFIFNHEDTDLDFRALAAGWKCIYVPDAIVLHRVSATLASMSARSVYYFSRNSEFVWLKNAPLWLMLRYLHHRVLYEITSFGYFGIMHGQWRAFLKGKADAVKMATLMLRKRKYVQSRAKVSVKEQERVLTPFCGYLRNRLR